MSGSIETLHVLWRYVRDDEGHTEREFVGAYLTPEEAVRRGDAARDAGLPEWLYSVSPMDVYDAAEVVA